MHPLQWGIFRVKHRRDRRPGLPLESPAAFYARYAAETARKAAKLARRWRHLKRILAKIEADPNAKLFMDEALTPVGEEDAEHMELYNQSESIKAAVKHERRVAGQPVHAHSGNGHDGNGHRPAAEANGHAEAERSPPPRQGRAAPGGLSPRRVTRAC